MSKHGVSDEQLPFTRVTGCPNNRVAAMPGSGTGGKRRAANLHIAVTAAPASRGCTENITESENSFDSQDDW